MIAHGSIATASTSKQVFVPMLPWRYSKLQSNAVGAEDATASPGNFLWGKAD